MQMTLDQLTTIIRTADKTTITKQLRELGYTLCNKDKRLGKVGIVELVNAITQETEDFIDSEHKHLYNGRICETVKGYENYEFIIINVFDIKPSTNPFDDEETAIQTEMHIWTKEMEKWKITTAQTVPTANRQTIFSRVGAVIITKWPF